MIFVYIFRRFAKPYIPHLPGMNTFEGDFLHSNHYNCPSRFQGNKVIVIGAHTSGQDISLDISPFADKVIFSIYIFHNKMYKVIFAYNLFIYKDGYTCLYDLLIFHFFTYM